MYKGYIYRHWLINDEDVEKSYIGQTYLESVEQRWGNNGKGYTYDSKKEDKKADHKFARAINKYGWDSFNHEIIGIVEAKTLEQLKLDLDEWEKYYIEKYDSCDNGYNSDYGGTNGKVDSEETKLKKSQSHMGEKNAMYGVRFYGENNHNYGNGWKISGEKHYLYGQHLSEETKHKMSQSRIGKYKGTDNANAKSIILIKDNEAIRFDCRMDVHEELGLNLAQMSTNTKLNHELLLKGEYTLHGSNGYIVLNEEDYDYVNTNAIEIKIMKSVNLPHSIVAIDIKTNEVFYYDSIADGVRDLTEKTGKKFNHGNITVVCLYYKDPIKCQEKYGRKPKQHKGYKWCYIEDYKK